MAENKENMQAEEPVTEPEMTAEDTAEEVAEEAVETAEAEVEETEGEAEETEEAGSEGKGFFKRKKKEDKKDIRIAELEDRVKRQLAEFENFRNRTEKEKSHMYEIGAKDIVDKILPVVDNFERGLATVPEDKKDDPFVQGMEMTYKQLMTIFEQIGVKPIEAVGHEFDPNLHNAVMQVESEELESGMVAQEFQKGYTYRDSVVRHSMVSVVS